MKSSAVKVMVYMFVLLLLGLTGCSSGGGGGASGVTLSGTAATGTPFKGAVVTITDSTGAIVGTSGALSADGSFSIKLDPSAKAPFILKAVLDNIVLYSAVLEAKDTTVNISQITDLIVARLSPTGDPAAISPADITTSSLTAKTLEVKNMLAPLFMSIGVTTDPLNGVFKADGTGLDRVLDSLIVTITPSGAASNIEVAVKGLDAPVQFSSNATSLAALAAPALSALPANGLSVLITDFLNQMTACYAVPAASRVDNINAASPVLTSSTCTALFMNNDPTQYRNNGNGAGKNKDFNGMFSGSTVTFSNGTYDFTRANGDIVIGYRWVDSTGNAQYESAVVRNVSGALKLVGNQYLYGGGVIPYAQYREFLNSTGYNYYSVGYDFRVPNTQVNNAALFDHVDVLTPYNTTIVLKPIAGTSNLGIVSGGNTVSTTFIRLRSEWAGNTAPAAAAAPRDFDTSLVFVPVDMTENAIISSKQSTWTFNYYLASAPGTIAQTQIYRTRNRTMSIAELKSVKLASLTNATTTALISASSVNKKSPTPVTGGISVDWTVPTGSLLPPTSLKAWGKTSANSVWDDNVSILSTLRSGAIPCSTQSVADTHCFSSTSANFAAGDTYNLLHLWARDVAGREFAHGYALYF